MYQLTDEQIKELISCPKTIVTAPKKAMIQELGHFRNSMELESIDRQHRFEVFMRKSVAFEEHFSIGLQYKAKEEPSPITLLRMNGAHGKHNNNWPQDHPHYGCHIHIAKEESIKQGLTPEKHAHTTNKYISYDDALLYFIEHCNIKDADKYINLHRQQSLFENEG